ncbi:MAG: glycosyltransferase family 2 protein [Verrucomicrobiales bacterium]|nr:glycosyltransferase family 2 protein [Verrucomicrobiales bacterium]
MKISVLINNYNYARFLPQCVESALNQTLPPHEVVIVDDGSTDNSLELLQCQYGGHPLIRIVSQPNQGQTAAVAAGVRHVTGDITCLLDADDWYEPEYLARLAGVYARQPQIDCVFCRYNEIGGSLPHTLLNVSVPDGADGYDFGYSALLEQFTVSGGWLGNVPTASSFKTSLLRRIPLAELAARSVFPTSADPPLWYAAALLGGRKFYFPQALVNYRYHGTNHWFGNEKSRRDYRRHLVRQTYRRFFAHWFCLGHYQRWELELEMAAVPNLDPLHRAKYQDIINHHNSLHKMRETVGQRLKRTWFYERQRNADGSITRHFKLFGFRVYTKRRGKSNKKK